MISIILYQFDKRVNSTKQPTEDDVVIITSGQLNNTSGVLAPLVNFTTIDNPSNINYAYIASFGRYYYIDDWRFGDGFWQAQMHVDVLASWKDGIGSSTQYVTRAYQEYDGDIVDTLFPAKSTPVLAYSPANEPDIFSINNVSYILGIIANSGKGAVTYYGMTEAQFSEFSRFMLENTDYLGELSNDINSNTIKAFYNPLQYVASVIQVPYNTGTIPVTNIPFGWWNFTTSANLVGEFFEARFTFNIPKHPLINDRGVYLQKNPYTELLLFMPGFGTVNINPSLCSDILYCFVSVDNKDGTAIMKICSENSKDSCFAVMVGNVSAPVQVGMFATMPGNAIKGVAQALTGIKDFLTGDFIGAVDGIQSALHTDSPLFQTMGVNGSISAFADSPSLTAKFLIPTDDYRDDMGRPLCKVKRIDTLAGYIKCGNADLSLPATAGEIDKITSYMDRGFFYE